MRNILVLGIVVNERDPFGGIIDIDRDPQTGDEVELIAKIHEALNEQRPDHMNPNAPFVGSGYDLNISCDINWEPIPFTGTIDKEVLIFVE